MHNQENEWRLIELETHNAFLNMALDEAITESVAAGTAKPTIRFYQWKPSAVSIGYFQSLEQEVHAETCANENVDIVRRRTGGGAVYHDHAGEITYSVIAPETFFPKGITESYWEICDWVVKGLEGIGLKAEFKPINDIIVSGKKISGNAQTRRQGVLLQHGTILYDLDVEKMFSYLNVSNQKISDKMIASVKDRVTSVKALSTVSRNALYESLKTSFSENKTIRAEKISATEFETATQLAKEKYASEEWLKMR